MISEYKRIYEDLYENSSDNLISSLLFMIIWTKKFRTKRYKDSFEYFKPLLPFTKKSIDEAINAIDGKREIRSDAKYFLLINLFYMVAVPLTLHKPEKFSPAYKENIRKDVELILAEASKLAPKKREITTTDIVAILPNVWENLGLNNIKIWGNINE